MWQAWGVGGLGRGRGGLSCRLLSYHSPVQKWWGAAERQQGGAAVTSTWNFTAAASYQKAPWCAHIKVGEQFTHRRKPWAEWDFTGYWKLFFCFCFFYKPLFKPDLTCQAQYFLNRLDLFDKKSICKEEDKCGWIGQTFCLSHPKWTVRIWTVSRGS